VTGHEVIALVIATAVAWWLIRAMLVPYAGCRWCGGTGRNPLSTSRRHGDCWFCHGQRRRMVLGAKSVHKVIRHIRESRRGGWGK
jgi:hypothetical protein